MTKIMTDEQLTPRGVRYVEAYTMMATEAKYRPQAPGDGMGGVYLSVADAKDPDLLRLEAQKYALEFNREEDTRSFNLGCSDFMTNRAFIFVIEAARLLASGMKYSDLAIKLLRMAIKQIEAAQVRNRQIDAANERQYRQIIAAVKRQTAARRRPLKDGGDTSAEISKK